MQYGVMATCMCYAGGFINGEFEHYQPASNTLDPNHSVSIIGWDDSREIAGTPDNGAWLVKNSWGSGWGNDGYFWISYYDKHAGQHPEMGAVSFTHTEPFQYDHVYYHDYHGWRDTKSDVTEALNAFVMEGTETIEAVSFFTAVHDVDFTAIIYSDFDGNELSNALATVSGYIEFSGFHHIDLNDPLELEEGDDFYVYLHLSDGGHPYDRTSIVPVLLCAENSKTVVPSFSNPDESYYYDGTEWLDFYYYDDPSGYQNTGNFCIKALTTMDVSIGTNDIQYQFGDLNNNFPNPFSEGTTIRFNLSEAASVRISVINIVGQEIFSTTAMTKTQGEHSIYWNGKNHNNEFVKPGVYLVKLVLGGQVVETQQMLKMR